jgi:hypothetical protein
MPKPPTLLMLALPVIAPQGCQAEAPVPVPRFSIEVTLSDAAATSLRQAGELIGGSVYFDGDGTPLPGIKTAPFRDVFLGRYDFALERPQIIVIDDAYLSKEAFLRLEDANYHYVVNVYSGRRAFPENILSCSVADGRFADLRAQQPIRIHCGLGAVADQEP